MSSIANGPQTPVKQPRRRTLQSGFSLLARGEPRIWLTGGMLVLCLFMIASLLALILANGLATFWPKPIDWLLLNNQSMNVGEFQYAVEPSDATEDLKRFYRTANFDISQEHYRWFESNELSSSGIVRPKWALVIERLSYGRLQCLPSRLTVNLDTRATQSSSSWNEIRKVEQCFQELRGELEQLNTNQPATTNAVSETNPADKPSEATTAPAAADLMNLIATQFEEQLARSRSEALHQAIKALPSLDLSHLQWTKIEGSDWTTIQSSSSKVAIEEPLRSARLVWDEPDQIVSHFNRLSYELDAQRQQIKRLMHEMSILDRRLSEARVDVRQSEIDTGAKVLEKIDEIGGLAQEFVLLAQREKALIAAAAAIDKTLASSKDFQTLKQLFDKYRQENLAVAKKELEDRRTAWRAQFDGTPETVQRAIRDFENAWMEVLQEKYPIEKSIEDLRALSASAEMTVALPNNATLLELTASDLAELEQGKLNSKVRELLQGQGVVLSSETGVAIQYGASVTQIDVPTVDRGLQTIWFRKPSPESPADAPSTTATAKAMLTSMHVLNCQEIVRMIPVNQLSLAGKLSVYVARWREFLLDDPREANSEGGVFPAIWGTVVMTLIMTLAVVPFGVIAALYLREYTRSGPLVSLVRISINNLAGVPSIVYGVFGLAFFCYTIGAFVDGGAKNADIETLPSGSWYLLLGVTAVLSFAAFVMSFLASGPAHLRSPLARTLASIAPWFWLFSIAALAALILKSPFFSGFYEARLPSPTFGKEGLLWASLTLALLTLPVVIVATEEALAAVPNSLREGSLACGASKWQTIYRIVLPHARPGILTGAILAMARGVGEVAPLMLVGALPVAPDLPLDSEFPFFHGSRSFMHLGYQIYWLGFQSQNSEASKPMVFTCTLLLILIVAALNLSAILLRARLRRRFQGNQF